MPPAKLGILLATYNGEKYLDAQLASLRDQTYRDWQLQVRDDGSTDGTLALLAAHARADRRIEIIPNGGRNLGAMGNFAELLRQAEGFEYVMFCDQDDIWLPDKIETLLRTMRSAEQRYGKIPLLVHADLAVVDSQLRPLAPSFWQRIHVSPRRSQLRQLIVENFAPGCSMLFNRPLRDLALPIPAGAAYHDWWVALVASAFGRIERVETALTLYRHHGANQVGAPATDTRYFLSRIPYLLDNSGLRRITLESTRQAEAFYARFADKLDPQAARMVADFATLLEDDYLTRRVKQLRYRFFKHGLTKTLSFLTRL